MRLATWNLENLRDPERAGWLGARVAALRPDVLGVQEVGDGDAFAALARAADLPHAWRSAHVDERGMGVGLLSRWPALAVADRRPERPWMPEGRARRGALSVTLAPPDRVPLLVVVAHLKSGTAMGATREPDGSITRESWAAARVLAVQQRVGEAAALRLDLDELLAAAGGPADAAVLADLNDVAASEALLLLSGPNGRDAPTDALRLYPTTPPGGRTIDHILLTRDLRLRATGGAAQTLPVPYRLFGATAPGAPPAAWPDHAPVWIDVA